MVSTCRNDLAWLTRFGLCLFFCLFYFLLEVNYLHMLFVEFQSSENATGRKNLTFDLDQCTNKIPQLFFLELVLEL